MGRALGRLESWMLAGARQGPASELLRLRLHVFLSNFPPGIAGAFAEAGKGGRPVSSAPP